jgi:two-component system C4-dicarboxylate transport response regulator DctD
MMRLCCAAESLPGLVKVLAVIVSNNILVIDDDPIIQRVVSAMLSVEGLQIRTAGSVADALALIDQQRPDVAICDMVMESATGLDFLNHCRQVPELATMPIIVISGSGDQQQLVEQALLQGAFACLAKPFSKVQIIDMVKMALQDSA